MIERSNAKYEIRIEDKSTAAASRRAEQCHERDGQNRDPSQRLAPQADYIGEKLRSKSALYICDRTIDDSWPRIDRSLVYSITSLPTFRSRDQL